jgi:hypothetical protein
VLTFFFFLVVSLLPSAYHALLLEAGAVALIASDLAGIDAIILKAALELLETLLTVGTEQTKAALTAQITTERISALAADEGKEFAPVAQQVLQLL